jgi:hypothetical protein
MSLWSTHLSAASILGRYNRYSFRCDSKFKTKFPSKRSVFLRQSPKHSRIGYLIFSISFVFACDSVMSKKILRESDRRLSVKLVPTFVDRGVSHSQSGGFPRLYSRFSRPEPLLFLPSSSSIVLTTLSGPRSRLTTSQKIW